MTPYQRKAPWICISPRCWTVESDLCYVDAWLSGECYYSVKFLRSLRLFYLSCSAWIFDLLLSSTNRTMWKEPSSWSTGFWPPGWRHMIGKLSRLSLVVCALFLSLILRSESRSTGDANDFDMISACSSNFKCELWQSHWSSYMAQKSGPNVRVFTTYSDIIHCTCIDVGFWNPEVFEAFVQC